MRTKSWRYSKAASTRRRSRDEVRRNNPRHLAGRGLLQMTRDGISRSPSRVRPDSSRAISKRVKRSEPTTGHVHPWFGMSGWRNLTYRRVYSAGNHRAMGPGRSVAYFLATDTSHAGLSAHRCRFSAPVPVNPERLIDRPSPSLVVELLSCNY